MKIQAELKEGISKDGKKYIYLSIPITTSYEKRVFLDNAEIELIKLVLKKEQ